MVSMISYGIRVSVESFYQQNFSEPLKNDYMFAYKVKIENHNPFSIKILRRHWFIEDSIGKYNEVEGMGIIGGQPVIESGDSYEYISGANLHSEIGKMWGTYTVNNEMTDDIIEVKIPTFILIAPMKLN